jgi:hypothetical protein
MFVMPELPLLIEPDEDDEGCALYLVDGSIGGRPYRFMLDSGGVMSQVTADDYTTPLPVVRMDTSHGVHASATEPVVAVADVVVGPLSLPTLDVTRVERIPGMLRNILGMDVLHQHRCHFRLAGDPAGAVLELDEPADLTDALDIQSSSRGHTYVDVQWPGVTARACWDTGASGTIVNRDFTLAHPDLFEEVGMSAGTDATGARVETAVLLMAAPEISGHAFAKQTVFSVDLTEANKTTTIPMDMIIGYPTMSQANWLFDFPAGKWKLTTLVTKVLSGGGDPDRSP